MIKGQEHDWHIELAHIRAQLRWVLDNLEYPLDKLDSLSKRNEVQSKIENVYFTLDELCEQTKGEVNEKDRD